MDVADVPRCNARGRPLPYQEIAPQAERGGDIYWRVTDIKGMRDAQPRGGATRKVITKDALLSTFKAQDLQCAETVPQVKGPPGQQDSDVDSGIVGCSKPGQRVGSTSSTDTDSSQEIRHKEDFCLPVARKDSEKFSGAHFRTVKRNSCFLASGNPVKGDHSVLKECNRRPPTPLTVFTEANQSVRLDDQSQLSEQSIRHSCRKLFATLYAQRFSYPSANAQESTFGIEDGGIEPHRNRGTAAPDSELRPSNACERLRTPKNTRTPVDLKNKENSGALNSCRKAVSWNLSHPGHRLQRQMTVPDTRVAPQVSASPCFSPKKLRISGTVPTHLNDCRGSLKSSTDSGIAGCRTRCNCTNGNSSSGFSSQSSTSSNSSTSTHHSCRCSQASQASPNSGSPSLFKSKSCSTLPSMLLQAGQRVPPPPRTAANGPESSQRCVLPLQKTSSCSNLMSRNRNVSFANVPVYSDSMMHVYAQVASVVPDSGASQTNSHNDLPSQVDKDQVYDTVRSPPVAVPLGILRQRSGRIVNFQAYEPSRTNSSIPYSPSANYHSIVPQSSDNEHYYETKAVYSQRNIPMPAESFLPAHNDRMATIRRENQRSNAHSYSATTLRPATSTEGQVRPNGYLKSAMKQPKTASHHNVFQASEAHYSQNGIVPSEAEYAMVDKSKKNRFASLPALNRYNSNTCIQEEEKEQPPVPPKKNLHKSDFNLHRSRSSSPKKGFREKVNGLTKSAVNAFQRAFSTERIYRPEREERLEATGQSFRRSKSFIKGLRASLSKKRKKSKPPMAEVVPQASCNPIWDEHPSGPNSPVHVRGQLLQLNLDGSQVVELSKPPSKPYGFFVARGRVRNSRGVFVSRMRDQETQKQLAGLLDIGDEILEIEGHSVKEADIMEVNNLMANKNTLLLTVLPYICRKDI